MTPKEYSHSTHPPRPLATGHRRGKEFDASHVLNNMDLREKRQPLEHSRKNGSLTTILSNHGGVGKSTAAMYLANAINQQRKIPTIMLDLDPHPGIHLSFMNCIKRRSIRKGAIPIVQPNLMTFQAAYDDAVRSGRKRPNLEDFVIDISKDGSLRLLAGGESLEGYANLSNNFHFMHELHRLSDRYNIVADTPTGIRSIRDLPMKVAGISDNIIMMSDLDIQSQNKNYSLANSLQWFFIDNVTGADDDAMRNIHELKKLDLDENNPYGMKFHRLNEDNYFDYEKTMLKLNLEHRSSWALTVAYPKIREAIHKGREMDIHLLKIKKAREYQNDIIWFYRTIQRSSENTYIYLIMNKVEEGSPIRVMKGGRICEEDEEEVAKKYFGLLKTNLERNRIHLEGLGLVGYDRISHHKNKLLNFSDFVDIERKVFNSPVTPKKDLKGMERDFYSIAQRIDTK